MVKLSDSSSGITHTRADRSRTERVLHTILVALLPAAALLALAASFVWWSQAAHAFFGRRNPSDAIDFVVFYSSAKLVATGHAYQVYDLHALAPIQRAAHPGVPGAALPIPYLNPPFFALLVAPLGYLSFGHAYQVWTGMKLTLLVLDAWMIWRIATPAGRHYQIVAVAFFVTLEPVAFSVTLGQFSLILTTSWTAAYLFFREGRDRAGAIALAPLLIKPELLVPVAVLLAWKRRTLALVHLCGFAAAAMLASIALIGIHSVIDYPRFVLTISAQGGTGINRQLMFGWNGILASFLQGRHEVLRHHMHQALTLGTVAAVWYAWRGPWRNDDRRFTAQWMLLTLATVLVDPHFYIQDISLVFPVGIAVAVERKDLARSVAMATLGLGWAVLALGLIPMRDWHLNVFGVVMALAFVALTIEAGHTLRAHATVATPETDSRAIAA